MNDRNTASQASMDIEEGNITISVDAPKYENKVLTRGIVKKHNYLLLLIAIVIITAVVVLAYSSLGKERKKRKEVPFVKGKKTSLSGV